MNPTIITTIVAVALISGFAWAALRHSRQEALIGDADSRWQKVDMQAFLNLVDPAEERYLRRNLSTQEFHRIQRMRVWAMWEYLGRLSANSKLMMRAGQMVQHHGTEQQAREATQLVAAASRMRMLIFATDVFL